MSSIIFFAFALIVFSANADAAQCDSGWAAYKDELCIQVFETEFLSYADAKDFCIAQSSGVSKGSLVIINGPELQELLADHTSTMYESMWLGCKYDDASAQFLWEDGEPLSYINWQTGYPRNITDEESCIEFRPVNSKSNINSGAKWADVVCKKRNMVMCQRTPSWSLEDAVEAIIKLRKQHQEDIEVITAKVVPIGSIYVEYANQPSPVALWPSLSWEDISGTYAGLFFRASGGGSDAWGATQGECSPIITQFQYTDKMNSKYPNPMTIPANGWSDWGLAGYWYHEWGDWSGEGMRFHTQGCEVRPKNQAVRIWKRTA